MISSFSRGLVTPRNVPTASARIVSAVGITRT